MRNMLSTLRERQRPARSVDGLPGSVRSVEGLSVSVPEYASSLPSAGALTSTEKRYSSPSMPLEAKVVGSRDLGMGIPSKVLLRCCQCQLPALISTPSTNLRGPECSTQ